MTKEIQYDIIIKGAGPAGCACALALKDAGVKVALLDKNLFPRDKICGDAIPGRAIKTINKISQELANAFKQFPHKYHTSKTTMYYKSKQLDLDWSGEAYTCSRLAFDNFLFTQVQQLTNTDIYCDFKTDTLTVDEQQVSITDSKGNYKLTAKLLIGADGAHSETAKQLAKRTVDKKHHAGSVRAYYSNISGTEPFKTEVYFNKRFLPSYMWVFPLPDNKANVGFGMLSSEIAKRNINLKKTFHEFIEATPELAIRFKDAVQISSLDGFALPFGSRKVTVSGNRYMLVGDAASLIDPISGDGIGNAMLSGKLAAEQAVRCLAAQNYSDIFMSAYDKELYSTLGAELKSHHRIQQVLFKAPVILDIVFAMSSNAHLRQVMKRAF